MAGPKTLRALSHLLSYPDEQTVESAELLYIILQHELPEAAKHISAFGSYLEKHPLWETEEVYTSTFDLNPSCALDLGWHLFGEEYARGLFLVRMRQELAKHGLEESAELPDHLTHVLAVIAAMSEPDAERFVCACVLPAVNTMRKSLESVESPYRDVIVCLALILNHVWGNGESLDDGSQLGQHPDMNSIPAGVDLLHAFPVADINPGCGSGCGSSGENLDHPELVQLTPSLPRKRSDQS